MKKNKELFVVFSMISCLIGVVLFIVVLIQFCHIPYWTRYGISPDTIEMIWAATPYEIWGSVVCTTTYTLSRLVKP